MTWNEMIDDQDSEELQPDLNTMRMLEDDGKKYRIYLTMNGAIACDRFDTERQEWLHIPLRKMSEEDIRAILSVRYSSKDEEIARAISAHRMG